jgi:hypothetical protein
MRFAYIDSNGNEVPIPSVDALALRIELGAIKESTELYDAQADQWGPADTHEIFHTLVRAAEEGDQAFVAPPPPVAPAEEEAPGTDESRGAVEEPAMAESREPADAIRDLTLAPAPPDPDEEAPPLDAELEDDLATVETSPQDGGTAEAQPVESGFDFGDLEGGLELEESFESPDADVAQAPMDFSPGAGIEEEDFGDDLDQAFDYTYADSGYKRAESLDLEKPLSEFNAEAPPAWMDADSSEADVGEVMDFSAPSTDVIGDEGVSSELPLRDRRTPRTRPSPPRFKSQRSLVAPIVGVVLLLAVGLGAYVAWPIVSARIADDGDSVDPDVGLPAVPDGLSPQMQEVADAAFASALQNVRAAGSGPVTPGPDWLSGRYLAAASEFPEAESFWMGVGEVLDAVRDIDLDAFREAFESHAARAGVVAEERAALTERAAVDFRAGQEARAETYGLVDELIDAALGLHSFLVTNEENIEYTPASTRTNDPVLEAEPSTPEIGEALENRIDRVTEALDALDYLDLVTADGLWAAVLRRIQEVGIQ